MKLHRKQFTTLALAALATGFLGTQRFLAFQILTTTTTETSLS